MKTRKPFTVIIILQFTLLTILGSIAHADDLDISSNWVPVASPPDRALHSAIFDGNNDQMFIFGGNGYGGLMNDVWALDFDPAVWQVQWRKIHASGPAPIERNAHAATYDPSRGVMYVFGGKDSNDQYRNDLWALDLTLGGEVWEEMRTIGTPPDPRTDPKLIYDEVNDRLILFGGQLGAYQYFNDLWELDLSTNQWTELHPSGDIPHERARVGGGYVAGSQEMLIFGGFCDPYQFYNDVWSLSLVLGQEEWTEVITTGDLPHGRGVSVVGYDDVHSRMIIHGGWYSVAGSIYYLNDTWVLDDNDHWTQVSEGKQIVARRNATGICYNLPQKSILVTMGGSWYPRGATFFGDTQVLNIQ